MLSRKLDSTKIITSNTNAPFPVVGQEARQDSGNARVLEVLGEQSEAEQQPQEVREDHPLVQEMQPESGKAFAGLEAGERELVQHDCREPDQRDGKNVAVEYRDAQQRQREQDEIEGNAKNLRRYAWGRPLEKGG